MYFLGALALVAAFPVGALAASVTSFSPQGTVKDVRQARAQFSDAMVNFGDPRASQGVQPFQVQCTGSRAKPAAGASESPKYTTRWADSKNWILDFEKDLPAGVRCEFSLVWNAKTLEGKELEGAKVFTFTTGGPAIRQANPYEGSRIEPETYFVLFLDAPATAESIRKSAYFTVQGIQERIDAEIVTGGDREKIFKSSNLRYSLEGRPKEALDAVVILKAKRRFPESAVVELVWGAGIAAGPDARTTEDQRIRYQVIDPFKAEFSCGRENAKAACNPMETMALNFSRPTLGKYAKKIRLVGPGGKEWLPKGIEEERDEEPVYSVSFPKPLPANTAFTIKLPSGIVDDLGRKLSNASSYPLKTATAEYSPLVKFAAPFGIIERAAGGLLPVTVRNVEDPIPAVQGVIRKVGPGDVKTIGAWIDEVLEKTSGYKEGIRETPSLKAGPGAKSFRLPRPNGAKSFEVIGIPLKEPGFYQVELESSLLGWSLIGSGKKMYVPAAALVTNLSVHLKAGRESSLVWVTALDTGKPVAGAQVSIRSCDGKEAFKGQTDSSGIARLGGLTIDRATRCHQWKTYLNGYFAFAEKDGDFSFTHTSWSDGIEAWRFNLPSASYQVPLIAHAVLDRALFRAGETVHMKNFIRNHQMRGFASVPQGKRPKSVVIRHMESEAKYAFDAKWSARGEFLLDWTIPKDAELGVYKIYYSWRPAKEEDEEGYSNNIEAGSFRVEEFRVPLMRASIQAVAGPFVDVTSVPIDLSASYLAGGGASKLPVTVRHQIRKRAGLGFPEFEEFSFSSGAVQTGKKTGGEDGSESGQEKSPPVESQALELSASGTARVVLKGVPRVQAPQTVHAELEFSDPNGEVQTVSTSIPVYASTWLVGIKSESWFGSAKDVRFEVGVATPEGKPVADAPVEVELYHQKQYSHRKRLVGGYYGYEHFTEIRKLAKVCEGKTDAKGILRCQFNAPEAGSLILQAAVKDPQGRKDFAQSRFWAYGKDAEQWFGGSDHDRIDLLPAKKRYEPGDTARFQVRMPFKEATALVTVEREGVIESFVRPVTLENPSIEVPIKPNYAPNVFVSALVVRGRVADPKETALVDLARPAFKLGISEIQVGWKAHELKVEVKPGRAAYQVREKAKIRVKVTGADGKPAAAGTEVALAAVDQGLLELMGNPSWNLLAAMMNRRGHEIGTFTAQSQVIGKRHFGLKALPQGGDGGPKTTRELFDTLLLWRGSVPVNSQGIADVEIPLNDSLTEFKIVAVAHSGLDRFGTGSASIRSTQDLMILPGLSPIAREGDRIRNEVTLRNSTDKKMDVTLEFKVEGLAQAPAPQKLELAPGEAKAAYWDSVVPNDLDRIRYVIRASSDNGRHDELKVTQDIRRAVPVRVLQATIAQLEGKYELQVDRPADAVPGRGGIGITVEPTLVSSLEGVRRYMGEYPYSCLEQRVSRSVALGDSKLWKAIAADLPAFLDRDGLFRYFPGDRFEGSEILTAYVLSIAKAAEYELPGPVRESAIRGLTGFLEGRIVRGRSYPTADLSIRKVSAAEALSRHGALKPESLGSIEANPNLWPTATVVAWLSTWRRLANAPGAAEKIREADRILRARINFQGTRMTFSTSRPDIDANGWWTMDSTDSAAAKYLHSILEFPESVTAMKEDMPRLVRGVIARMSRGHWDLTTANAWGVLAVSRFSDAFEKVTVSGQTQASLESKPQSYRWETGAKGWKTRFDWPKEPGKLKVSHDGAGQPWLTVQASAALPLKEPLSSGYRIKKTWEPVLQRSKGKWSRGDVVKVRLEMDAQTDMSWVVLNDPIPAGSTILGGGLARSAAVLSQSKRPGDTDEYDWRNQPTFVENTFEGPKVYYEFLPKGAMSYEYTFRINQTGAFGLPPTRAEAMYSPELFGEIPNANVEIQP